MGRAIVGLLAAALLLGAGCATPTRLKTAKPPSRDQIAAAFQASRSPWAGYAAYSDPALQAYAKTVLDRLTSARGVAVDALTLEIVDAPFTNATLDIKNRVTISRPMFAILNDEAELAAVLAHELAHHELGHLKKPITIKAVVGADRKTILDRIYADRRQRESEADALSLEILAAAGYDQSAAARVIGQISASQPFQLDGADYLSTHPSDKKRIAAIARRKGGATHADRYLDAIDGLRVGAPNQATRLSRGAELLVPGVGLAFTPPQGFELIDHGDGLALKNDRIGMLVLMKVAAASSLPPEVELRYLAFPRYPFAKGLSDTYRFKSLNGRDAVTAVAKIRREGRTDRLRITIIDDGDRRFHVTTFTRGRDLKHANDLLNAMDRSARPLTSAERRAIDARRLRIVTVRSGDTAAALSAGSGPDGARLFRLLNGLKPGQEPKPGARVKVVVEG